MLLSNQLNTFNYTSNKNNNTSVDFASNTSENLESSINAELLRLKGEEKKLQTMLEFKLRKELVDHLERDKQLEEVIQNTKDLNSSLSLNHEQNMTTTHLLLHKITNDCPMCENNGVNSLIFSSSNERNSTKIDPNTMKSQTVVENPKANVVFSKAYKNARPKYVSNLKTLVQTPIIRDFDASLKLSFSKANATKKTDSESMLSRKNLSQSVQFSSPPNYLTTNSRLSNSLSLSNNTQSKDQIFEKTEPKYIQLPLSKTLVHDKAWNAGKNFKQTDMSYYPFRDSKLQRTKSSGGF